MKICVRCGSQNSSDYKFCKFCGAELPCVDQKEEKQYKNDCYNDDIDFSRDSENITIPEIDRFVGKNYEQITPKFVTLQQTGKKFMWCLPAFLFGLFFGLPGVAIWFLYRKMTKPAAFMLLASLVAECLNMFFAFDALTELYRVLFNGFLQYGNMVGQNPEAATEWLINYFNQLTVWADSATSGVAYTVFDFVNTYIIQIAAPITLSLLGWKLYKDYSIKKISDIKRTSQSNAHYAVRLSREGGTSIGCAIAGIAIYIAVSFVISLIPVVVTIINL